MRIDSIGLHCGLFFGGGGCAGYAPALLAQPFSEGARRITETEAEKF